MKVTVIEIRPPTVSSSNVTASLWFSLLRLAPSAREQARCVTVSIQTCWQRGVRQRFDNSFISCRFKFTSGVLLRSSWPVFVLLFVSEHPLFRSIHVFLMINRQLSFIKLENENILDSASHIQWRDHSPIIWPYNELCWIVTCKRYHLISPCVRKLVVRIYCRRSIQYADSSSHVSALLTFFISKPRVLDWNFFTPDSILTSADEMCVEEACCRGGRLSKLSKLLKPMWLDNIATTRRTYYLVWKIFY